ncbi:peptide MFS transporter [Rhodocaloribacter litoris]|uniref:peptide MFS transporter n=1 Tax=Rhodocaloribacter litoris TaxID=2558931 RepID=UPI001420EC7F|nr:peptide MFS transporter [Rhodocaloribacter litoris]QXD16402.1 peptide MFS transporter [Rhodocaloribacter litoris]
MASSNDPRAASARGKTFFGHPGGLATLFFTEMWERFSYYGMRALLVLFMTAAAAGANPGLGFSDGTAAAVYGLYTFFVYVLSLPGGWVADNLWGQRKAVFVGGCIIALGHFTMAGPLVGLPDLPTFFGGLLLIVIGTGLLKPNVSTIVGELYPEGGARRDAGFSIFYMGINLGAFIGPLICGYLGENINWHYGFSAAGFGMVLGLVQYKLGERMLGAAGHLKTGEGAEVLAARSRRFYAISAAVLGTLGLLAWMIASGMLAVSIETVARTLGVVVVVLAVLYFAYLILLAGHTREEKKRLGVIFWLFILAAMFWSGFEQAGSSLNLFAERLTDRVLFGWEAPASWLQSVNPIFIIIGAPLFGMLWVSLARRNANPSIPVKFALGLLGLAAGFFVLAWGAAHATPENPVSPAWLVVTYALHTSGELCLSPVGLSSITKLAPENRVGQMMGVWFIASALGNLIAGLVAGQLENLAPAALFLNVGMIVGGAGMVALLVSPAVRKLMGNVE